MKDLDEREFRALRRAWAAHDGKSWEPAAGTKLPIMKRAVECGYLRITDGRFLFERFPNTHLSWTPAGRRVMEMLDAQELAASVPEIKVA